MESAELPAWECPGAVCRAAVDGVECGQSLLRTTSYWAKVTQYPFPLSLYETCQQITFEGLGHSSWTELIIYNHCAMSLVLHRKLGCSVHTSGLLFWGPDRSCDHLPPRQWPQFPKWRSSTFAINGRRAVCFCTIVLGRRNCIRHGTSTVCLNCCSAAEAVTCREHEYRWPQSRDAHLVWSRAVRRAPGCPRAGGAQSVAPPAPRSPLPASRPAGCGVPAAAPRPEGGRRAGGCVCALACVRVCEMVRVPGRGVSFPVAPINNLLGIRGNFFLAKRMKPSKYTELWTWNGMQPNNRQNP